MDHGADTPRPGLTIGHLDRMRQEVDRLLPWSKFRGRARLTVTPVLTNPQVVVAKDTLGQDLGGVEFNVFICPEALELVRAKWAGDILGITGFDGQPNDGEIAAWLAWILMDKGGD